ncbi:MAG: DUF2281 domain-containing protein [Verrucomicrobia bacterium]|nr:DUF2281 domain-containing protein [Verrucomicrobiota bacterium]
MSTITAILEADADGMLHLPVPAELRHGKVKVEATLELVEVWPTPDTESLKGLATLKGKTAIAENAPSVTTAPQPGCLKGFWMARDFDEPLEDFKEYME